MQTVMRDGGPIDLAVCDVMVCLCSVPGVGMANVHDERQVVRDGGISGAGQDQNGSLWPGSTPSPKVLGSITYVCTPQPNL